MSMKELARAYQDAGIPVFPCRAKDEDGESLKTGEIETMKEKTPYTSGGLNDASKSERFLDFWWNMHADAMPGIPTGEASGVWVLDIDVPSDKHKKDGRKWLDDLIDKNGPLPETVIGRTANGGYHLYFKHHPEVRNRVLKDSERQEVGVDVRGEGGFVIAPGSVMEDGRFYDQEAMPTVNEVGKLWTDNVAEAPQWLLDAVINRVDASTIERRQSPQAPRSGSVNQAYIDGSVDREIDELETTAEGGRGDQLNRSAFNLGQFVAGGHISRGEAENLLYNAAITNGLMSKDGERQVLATIRRGLDGGVRSGPRNIPEKKEGRERVTLRNINSIIENGLRKGEDNRDGEEETLEEYEIRIKDRSSRREDDDDEDDLPVVATPFRWTEPSALPRREFLFGSHYARKYVSVTVSPGGIGKTSNSIVEGLSMTSGFGLLGDHLKPPERLNVWIFNAEDPMDELARRTMAACLWYDLRPEDFEGRLYIDSGRQQELVVMEDNRKDGIRPVIPIVESVVEMIRRRKIDVMIIDPFVSTHGVNENDNGAIDKVAKLWAQIADYTNCAIDIVHHLKKVDGRAATVEDARGAVSLIGAARSVRVLNRMTEEEADNYGLDHNERFSCFNVGVGKANLAPLNSDIRWRRLESQPLGNEGKDGEKGDDAPVVTEFLPSKVNVLGDVDGAMIRLMRTEFKNCNYTESPKAQDWAGSFVAQVVPGINLEDPAGRKRAGSILRALIKKGDLVVKSEVCPARRKPMKFIRSTD